MTRRSQSGKETRSVSEILAEPRSSFSSVLKQASRLLRIQRLLQGYLDPGLRDHVRVAAIQDNELVLITSSAAQATQIRMRAAALSQSLRADGYREIDRIVVRVAPDTLQPAKPTSTRSLSTAAEHALGLMRRLTGKDTE
jgi:hypothetical protein